LRKTNVAERGTKEQRKQGLDNTLNNMMGKMSKLDCCKKSWDKTHPAEDCQECAEKTFANIEQPKIRKNKVND
jgi:hypothetical protein